MGKAKEAEPNWIKIMKWVFILVVEPVFQSPGDGQFYKIVGLRLWRAQISFQLCHRLTLGKLLSLSCLITRHGSPEECVR